MKVALTIYFQPRAPNIRRLNAIECCFQAQDSAGNGANALLVAS